MGVRQTRVFVLSTEPNNWAETLIGKVFRPLTEEFADSLNWFWFSRYGSLLAGDSADCDIAQIPDEYKQEGFHRSMRFRFSVADNRQDEFETCGRELISNNGYRIFDFRDYEYIGDTGNHRHLGIENRQPGRAEQRALHVTKLYMAISQLVIDALVGPDNEGGYRLEENDDRLNNPRGSTFQTLLHLFCNITDVPTEVWVFHKQGLNLIGFGTFMYPPPAPDGAWDSVTTYPIRY